MSAEEREELKKELRDIALAFATSAARAEERDRATIAWRQAIEARLSKLEVTADETGRHDIERLRAALERSKAAERQTATRWDDRIWSFGAGLAAAGIVGLVGYLLSTL